MSSNDSWECFFSENAKPNDLTDVSQRLGDFCRTQSTAGRNLVLVTSGGTTVPFEKNTVRFLDNFSHGTRGSASAEHFLANGYAVLFLHRSGSLRPFGRHLDAKGLLDVLEERDGGQTLAVKEDRRRDILSVVRASKAAEDKLLEISFTTLADYLWLLRTVCEEQLAKQGKEALLYLAAAVADFYVPAGSMAEHKLQSSEGAPDIKLALTPKMLAPLVKRWVPQAYVVSFKVYRTYALDTG